MGLFDIFDDVIDITKDIGKVVLGPVEIATKGIKEVTKVAADLAEDVKDEIIK